MQQTILEAKKGKMMNQAPTNEPRQAPVKEVFTIIDRDNAKSRWIRVGVGFVNRDNSINIVLDSIPLNGRLQVRDMWSGNTKRKESQNAAQF